jgi:hypothetical protein
MGKSSCSEITNTCRFIWCMFIPPTFGLRLILTMKAACRNNIKKCDIFHMYHFDRFKKENVHEQTEYCLPSVAHG